MRYNEAKQWAKSLTENYPRQEVKKVSVKGRGFEVSYKGGVTTLNNFIAKHKGDRKLG